MTPPRSGAAAFQPRAPLADAEARLMAALLRASRSDAVLQDRIDCAELALEAGQEQAARIIYGLVFLQLGFSAPGLRLLRELNARTGLWPGLEPPAAAAPQAATGQFSADLAVSELRPLLRLKPDLGPEPDWRGALPAGELAAPAWDGRTLAALAADAAAVLAEVPELQAQGRLAPALRELSAAMALAPPVHLEEHLDASAAELAQLFGLWGLGRFLCESGELLAARCPEDLFARTCALDPAGLGPGFSNLAMVIRSARDVFALIRAASDGEVGEDILETWCVLMSGALRGGVAGDLVEELGDLGMTGALRRLMARTARLGAFERRIELLWRIRDAGLDLGVFDLAVDAQWVAALWRPNDPLEWSILGDLRAAAGDRPGAEEAFARALRLDPAREPPRLHLAALQAGAFEPLAPKHGYASSPVRRRIRLARRRPSAG